ncbi:hypothetical protein T10_5716 [Trichinella papuae]|uniref:Uncharacterized protein n=1 Tax=Trichinella papuae TaxID=268474 RepID=A0A0V1N1N4_9BILA|nr:hypothetical protein T10_5716 [Trichinella papuae]
MVFIASLTQFSNHSSEEAKANGKAKHATLRRQRNSADCKSMLYREVQCSFEDADLKKKMMRETVSIYNFLNPLKILQQYRIAIKIAKRNKSTIWYFQLQNMTFECKQKSKSPSDNKNRTNYAQYNQAINASSRQGTITKASFHSLGD